MERIPVVKRHKKMMSAIKLTSFFVLLHKYSYFIPFTATLTIGQMIIARNEPKSAATNCVVEYVTFAIVTIFGASEAPNCGIAHCTISSVIIPAFAN